MWAGVVFVLLAGVPACRGTGYSAYQYYETGGEGDADFYDNYNDDVHRVPTTMTTDVGAHTRNKRYGDRDVRTLDPKEIHDVKGALNKILYGNKLESILTQPDHQEYTDIYDYADKAGPLGEDTRNDSRDQFRGKVQKGSPSELGHVQHWSPHIGVQKWSPDRALKQASRAYKPKEAELQKLIAPDTPRKWSPAFDIREPTATEQTWMPSEDATQDTPETRTYSNEEVKEDIKKLLPQGVLPREWTSTVAVQHWSPSSTITVQRWSPDNYYEETLSITMSEHTKVDKQVRWQNIQVTRQEIPVTGQDIQALHPKYIGKSDKPHFMRQHFRKTDMYGNKKIDDSATLPNKPPGTQTRETVDVGTITVVTPIKQDVEESEDSEDDEIVMGTQLVIKTTLHRPANVNATLGTTSAGPAGNHTGETGTDTGTPTVAGISTTSADNATVDHNNTDVTTTAVTTTAVTTTAVTTTVGTTTGLNLTTGGPTTKSPLMDINAIIAIIANLTYDYDWNLTEQFNKTLIDHGVPTCPTPSTPTTTTTTPPQYDFANTSVVGKCFVCGLKTVEIPRNAFCADAFAGDFLPLVPVDPRARGKIASFRKYCRHLDVHNFVENPSEPRSIYGRFTGGCGVRWTDLSGVYTQRTCRSRFRPLTGKHFGSKRMAKLELALINVENGCIISPMATLLPLSRGISLYARFHACVCTGSWCNRAVRMRRTTPAHALRAAVALLVCYTNYIR